MHPDEPLHLTQRAKAKKTPATIVEADHVRHVQICGRSSGPRRFLATW